MIRPLGGGERKGSGGKPQSFRRKTRRFRELSASNSGHLTACRPYDRRSEKRNRSKRKTRKYYEGKEETSVTPTRDQLDDQRAVPRKHRQISFKVGTAEEKKRSTSRGRRPRYEEGDPETRNCRKRGTHPIGEGPEGC